MTSTDRKALDAIVAMAADWYVAHRAGPLSEADRALFLAWLKASPLHIEEYLAVAALERSLDGNVVEAAMTVDEWVAVACADPTDNVVHLADPGSAGDAGVANRAIRPRRPRAPRRVWWSVAAACVGVAGVSTLWTVRHGHGPADVITYRTGHGEQATWPLPDGSTLYVNTDSAVTVRFSAAERLLDVDHGQVAVKVAHHDPRAFRVHAGATDAVAVGTEFDVYRQAETTLITVVTGQVAVSVGEYAAPRAAAARLPGGLHVAAGQQVKVIAGVLSAPARTELAESTAWLERKIVFERRALGAVADEFNRYNAMPFIIEDPTLRNLPISGTFEAADTDSFAAFLASLSGVRVVHLPDRFAVQSSRTR